MRDHYNLLKSDDSYEFASFIKKVRATHLASGGDPRDFPQFLEDNGVRTVLFSVIIDDRAKALNALLGD